MKQIILTAIILCSVLINAFSASYEETMGQEIQKMYQSQKAEELTEIANQFERIGQKETDKWLPGYYAAYSYISILFFNSQISNEEKLGYLNKAQKNIDDILKIDANESEIYTLQALLYQLSMLNPEDGYKYSTLSNEALGKAEKMNAGNPRVYYLKALNLFYTPEEYGGGVSIAKPIFEKADGLFQKETGHQSLLPSWGKEHNTMMLQQCDEKK